MGSGLGKIVVKGEKLQNSDRLASLSDQPHVTYVLRRMSSEPIRNDVVYLARSGKLTNFN